MRIFGFLIIELPCSALLSKRSTGSKVVILILRSFLIVISHLNGSSSGFLQH